jgi:hypothetical protein
MDRRPAVRVHARDREVAVKLGALAIGAILAAGCGPILDDGGAGDECAVDPLKELLVVDEAVMTSAAAMNAADGALSFRRAMERLATAPEDASAMTLAWIERWAPPARVCAWLRSRAANGCDADCGACAERHVDLADAPFRTIAVSNRIDLSEPAGAAEGRLVFAATDGPGDDPAAKALPLTVIVELRLPGDPAAWAARWHALGARAAFDAEYIRSLTELTDAFVRAENLAQIRVNDALGPSRATMHETHLDPAANDPRARLAPAGLRRTPARALDGSPALGAFVSAHRADILEDRFELPGAMLADRIELGETWAVPGVEEPLRRAFAASTCDGCHGGERAVIDGGFHVSPLRRGTSRLSRFLLDPEHRGDDELTRRAAVLRRLACAP